MIWVGGCDLIREYDMTREMVFGKGIDLLGMTL